MNISVFFGGSKGGGGKTSTAHLACLGAHLRNEAAVYVLTDPTRKVRGSGRPYGVVDGRLPAGLANVLVQSRNTQNGWTMIDGGGNRPDFDQQIAGQVNLSILPFRPSEEDLDTVADDLRSLPNSLAWPAAWPTNPKAQKAAQFLVDSLTRAFPGRVVLPPIDFVNSVNDLLGAELYSPSTPVRSLAKRVFATIQTLCEQRRESDLTENTALSA